MDDGNDNENGYDKIRDQILELCKLAQGNDQIKKRLKVLVRLVERLTKVNEETGNSETKKSKRIEGLIKKQTAACKELGDKIKLEIESLDAIRVASKAYGIDIKSRLLEIDEKLESSDIDEFFGEDDE